jgi:hypothetical protein
VRKILVVILVLIVSASGAFTAYALVIKAQARSILADISRLNVGVSPQLEVEHFAQRHKSQLEKKECKADQCWYFFEVRNRWLSWLRIEPAARFQAWVTVGNGKVEGLHAEVQRETRVFPTYPSAGIVEEYVKYPEYYHSGRCALWVPYSNRQAVPLGCTRQPRHVRATSSRVCAFSNLLSQTWWRLRPSV